MPLCPKVYENNKFPLSNELNMNSSPQLLELFVECSVPAFLVADSSTSNLSFQKVISPVLSVLFISPEI